MISSAWENGSDGQFAVLDPSSGELIAQVARAGTAELDRALDAAESAAHAWANRPPRERADVLRRTARAMAQHREQLAQLLCAEMGKPIVEARSEIDYAADFFSWFAEAVPHRPGEFSRTLRGGARLLTQHRPVGISLLITPWNFPLAMPARKLAPALAAGCTTLLKPSEDTPLTALALVELMKQAGLPPGVVNVLTTDRPHRLVEAALSDHRVRKLSFTGSTDVGRSLLAQASRRVVNCSMELGGNAPFIVLEGADLDLAVDAAVSAKMRNAGQACTAANRFLVQKGIFFDFADRLTARMRNLTLGSPLDDKVQVGPLINSRALDRVSQLVNAAVAYGARKLVGGTALGGNFYSPTVLVDVDRKSPIVNAEIFGPVAPILIVDDAEDAIQTANDTEMGLAAYIFTDSLDTGLRISDRLEAGMVAINRGSVSDAAAPFGGVKQSGLGREGGFEGINAYRETVCVSAMW